jgi:quinolinate synthase
MYNIDHKDLLKFGYMNVKTDQNTNIVEEINRLRKKKNASVLAHYYQQDDIQDIADFVGDSLALAQQAEKTNNDIIVMAGVHFMAETVKILCPEKKVLIPDLNAGCSLADSCPTEDFKNFLKDYKDHVVISYVNTSAEIKACSDIICTSANAGHIVNSVPKNKKIVFAPDKNLGNYISSVTGRKMVIWNGACHVHEEFSLERILKIKEENRDAKIIAHPECRKQILMVADHIGSTSSLLKFVQYDNAKKYIVATESGIIHQMKLACPDKNYIPAPPVDSTCGCNDCNFMKLNTLEKIYICLKHEMPEVLINEKIRKKALRPIKKMLEISEKYGL